MLKKIPFIKLKAGALQYTIFIAVVIAMVIFAFISLSYVQQQLKLKSNAYIQTIHITNLAISYAEKAEIPYNTEATINTTEGFSGNTLIIKKNWGVFDMATTISTINKEMFTKNAFIGGYISDRSALYLQDNNQPLVVVGQTRIEGKAFLPKQAVKRGTIAGNSYTGSQLIYGTVELSKKKLPQLENRKMLQSLCNGSFPFQGIHSFDLQEHGIFVNSFNNPTQVFSSNLPVDLQNISLTGNIIISSRSKIRVHESAMLKDVILIAPEIEILDHVSGNFQAFAKKKIVVGKNCGLAYPSGLILYEDKEATQNSGVSNVKDFNRIDIQEGSKIKGVIAFLSDNQLNNYKLQINIVESAEITGEVYCNGNLQLNGTVKGSVFTRNFITLAYGSVFQNHIFNGQILGSKLPLQYSGLLLENSKKSVAKWLYY